jgi:hypothetical protein
MVTAATVATAEGWMSLGSTEVNMPKHINEEIRGQFTAIRAKLDIIEEKMRTDAPLRDDLNDVRLSIVRLTRVFPVNGEGLDEDVKAGFTAILDRLNEVIDLVRLKQKVIAGEMRKIADVRTVQESYPAKRDVAVPTFVDTKG